VNPPLLEGFRRADVEVQGVRIATWVRGQGPPVLLLHGYPQTHVMWHAVAPVLAEEHTVVLTDLRGYGDSDAPPGGDDHGAYAKRTMAADQVGVMGSLGFEHFSVVGHDRGGRVGHRMALDHPARVDRLAVLDIVPTHHVFATADRALAQAYFHWFFLAQPGGLPERMIGADPDGWLTNQLERGHGGGAPFDPDARHAYLTAFRRPEVIAASCADYQAAATVDFRTDDDEREARVTCPLLVIWGEQGFVGARYDVLDVWRSYARRVEGRSLACGHFLPEECGPEVATELLGFLARPA
jgi:haloacetate dehalogenase